MRKIENYINEQIEPDEIEQDEQVEEQVERQQDAIETVNDSPQYAEKDDLFTLFWKVIKTEDSSKVGNLDKTELGILNISVRDCQRIAMLAETLGHPGFADYFYKMGEITLATSASKKGWLPELFVSTKKFATKSRESNLPQLQEPQKKKRFKFF